MERNSEQQRKQARFGGGAAEDRGITIYIAQEPVDFRLGINGLSTMIEATLKFDPFSRNLFCFVNKRRNQIKVLYWQRSGFCLWLKRLEEEKFKWPTHLAPIDSAVVRPPVVTLTEDQFLWLLEGLDLKHLKPHRALEYRSVL
ncbi:MAG: IS66 family insertion sequence element accessory protein TnpB [Hyphomicrobium sp.]